MPNFRKVSLGTVVRLASADDASADSSPDDETRTDYGLTVGNLPSLDAIRGKFASRAVGSSAD